MRNLINNPRFRKYFANTSWLLGERILRMTDTLFGGIYGARYLGPERFGLLSYTLSFVWLFSSLASFGLDDILVRELVHFPEQRKALLGTVFWLKIGGTVIMASMISIILGFVEHDKQTAWMIALIALGFFFQATNVIDFYFQARVQSKFSVRAQAFQLLITSLLKIYLILNHAELVWFAFALMLDQVVVAASFLVVYRWEIEWFPFFIFRWHQAKKLIRDAWLLMFAGLVVSIYMKIDQVMLKEMLDVKAVGIYSAAVKLCEAWYFLPTAVMASLFPAILEVRKISKGLYEERIQKLYDLLIWGALAVALPTTLLADWVIYIFYGVDFQEAAEVLKMYIWAGVFVSLGVVSSKWLITENLERYSLYITLFGAILNIVFNLYLIPIYGIRGAAIATLISYGTASYLSLAIFKKTRDNFWVATNALNPYGVYRRAFG